MDNCYIFTSGGFKPFDQVVDNLEQTVFAVNNQLECTLTKVDQWQYVPDQTTYCITNIDHQFKMWFNDSHQFYIIDEDRQVGTITGKQFYNDYQNRLWSIPTRFEIVEKKIGSKQFDVHKLQQMAKNQILSTEMIGNSSQLLYEWQRCYGGYYARNYKQAIMLQAVITGNGVISRVIRDNGFKIVPYSLSLMTIDRISSTSSKQFNFIPYDHAGNQLHLIYNVENYTYLL